MKKKRTFLLLEILIAIFIVSLCLIPLIQAPIRSYRAEMRLLEEMEGERLADWTFSEIKEKLLKNEIPWEKLPGTEVKSAPFSLPSATIQIFGAKTKKIERTFTLKCGKIGERTGKNGEVYRMFTVAIDFEPRLSQRKRDKRRGDYTYRLQARKLPREVPPGKNN